MLATSKAQHPMSLSVALVSVPTTLPQMFVMTPPVPPVPEVVEDAAGGAHEEARHEEPLLGGDGVLAARLDGRIERAAHGPRVVDVVGGADGAPALDGADDDEEATGRHAGDAGDSERA